MSFNAILNEVGVAHDPISNILLDLQIMDTVDGAGSVETIVNSVTVDIRFVDCTNQMEMDSVSTHLEGLACISNFRVGNSGDCSVILERSNTHDVNTPKILLGILVALNDNISGKETNFSPHFNEF